MIKIMKLNIIFVILFGFIAFPSHAQILEGIFKGLTQGMPEMPEFKMPTFKLGDRLESNISKGNNVVNEIGEEITLEDLEKLPPILNFNVKRTQEATTSYVYQMQLAACIKSVHPKGLILDSKVSIPPGWQDSSETRTFCSDVARDSRDLSRVISYAFPEFKRNECNFGKPIFLEPTNFLYVSLCNFPFEKLAKLKQDYTSWKENELNQIAQRKLDERLNAEKESVLQAEQIRLADSIIKNPNRTNVATKVLNYSSGCPDDGCENLFWIADENNKCVYQRLDRIKNQFVQMIDISKLDPKNIKIIERERSRTTTNPISEYSYTQRRSITTNYTSTNRWNTQDVDHSGVTIFSATQRDKDRLKRGWDLIFDKFCKGAKLDF